jgi:hypothetical protein
VITAVDTSVLVDVFGADPVFGLASRNALGSCLAQGGLIACEVVWAEIAVAFSTPRQALSALGEVAVSFSPMGLDAALAASAAFAEYRRRGGGRSRIVADFLIGAHALSQADRLLTRDRGFYRAYFKRLAILDPSRS